MQATTTRGLRRIATLILLSMSTMLGLVACEGSLTSGRRDAFLEDQDAAPSEASDAPSLDAALPLGEDAQQPDAALRNDAFSSGVDAYRCVPSCPGACGSDGCGGSCGMCAAGSSCVTGSCVPETMCMPRDTVVWLVGDSTVAPDTGWGESFSRYVIAGTTIRNRGRGGRSSKSYYDESDSYWSRASNAVLRGVRAGDYVLLQFGHNDSKPEADRHTEPGSAPSYRGSFRTYLERYITEARARGAIPILITPVSRMQFNATGHRRTHGDYPAAMRRVASDNDVVLLDLELRSHQVFDDLGQTRTHSLYSDGTDFTHFPADKAWRVSLMVATLLSESDSPLRCQVTLP